MKHCHRRILTIGMLTLGLLAAAGAGPARADTLVVADAHGVALQPGQAIDAGQPLKLQPGQRVTLIAGNGAILKLVGPFDGVPDPEGQRQGSIADSLLKLASQTVQGTSTLGAVRAPESTPPEAWLIAVDGSGQRCLQDGGPVVFWRPAAAEEQTVEISPSDRAWQAQAKWPAGFDKLAMPPSFPAQDDQTYVIGVGGTTNTVTLHLIPSVIASDAMRVAWMLEKGCLVQARVLVGSLK
jgi:hypothetical protein